MAKPILISLSPNTNKSDVWQAVKALFKPLKKGRSENKLHQHLQAFFNNQDIYLLNSGRSALELALKSLNLKLKDEVLCQALTCVAVPNAINWSGGKPVYVDTVKNGFNLDPKGINKKITKNTQAIIIQHNFGQPDNLDEIKSICQKHNLVLIEDCAHSLGAEYQGKKIGTFGDLSILSFGRDKIISSVFGGALIVNHKKHKTNVVALYSQLHYPSSIWTLKQLLHPIIMSTAIPLYFTLNLGKLLIFLYQKSGLLSFPVTQKEKNCQTSLPVLKLPNALAALALHQFQKLGLLNQHRRQIANIYAKELNQPAINPQATYLRFPLLVKNPTKLIGKAQKQSILLGDWYRPIISPKGVNLKKVGYQLGSCPNAETVSQNIVNLPTHSKMNLKDAQKITQLIKAHVNR